MLRRVVFVTIIVLQLGAIVAAYGNDHRLFGFQMFPEASRWRAEIVRVQPDGSRIAIDDDWEYRWSDLVRGRGLTRPDRWSHADSGLRSQLAFFESALDWVAANTPDDTTTQYLEATVTFTDNGREPETVVFRSQERPIASDPEHGPRPMTGATTPTWVRPLGHLDDVGDTRGLAVLRILLGPIVWLHLRPFVDNLRDGIIWSDRFTDPWVSWYPEPGRALSAVLLWTALVAAVAMSLGLATRLACATTALIVTHNLLLSTTFFAHNRAFLVILLWCVTVVPSGDHYSIDAAIRRLRGRPRPPLRPLWWLYLVRIQVALVYLASAVSKLLDGDWWGGRVLQLRAIDGRELAIDQGAPAWILDVLADDGFQWWFSKGAVLTEVFIGAGLLMRRTRLAAIWVAIPFHLAIQIGASVQVFSWAALAALCIWVTPLAGDRRLVVPASQRRFASMVTMLDWFGRFTVEIDDGRRLVLDDRPPHRGSPPVRRTSADARWTTLSRLPVTFWFAYPMRWWVRRRSTALRPARPTAPSDTARSQRVSR